MTIKCQICNIEFKSIITSTHLKKHDISSKDYKELYGPDSLASFEYREKQKSQSSGENNGMWGKTHSASSIESMGATKRGRPNLKLRGIDRSQEHREKISSKAKERWADTKYKKTNSRKCSDETKAKISQSLTGRSIDPESTKRAKESRILNGPLPGPMLGKKHSDDTRAKLSQIAVERGKQKTLESIETRKGLLSGVGFTLLNDITSDYLEFSCNTCSAEFTRSSQFLTAGKFDSEACPICYPRKMGITQSKLFGEVKKQVNVDFSVNIRGIIGRKELDLYAPESKVAVEYCGLFWHSDKFTDDKSRHVDKLQDCRKLGIKLLTVFEDEYLDRPGIVVAKIAMALGAKPERIFARNCSVIELDSRTANQFLNLYHLQGSGRSSRRYGLYHNGDLVSVMTFSDSNISRKIKGWEINRFCTKPNLLIVGGASKLFKQFLIDENPTEVISYADLRWGEGEVYSKLGFTKIHDSPPNYWYVKGGKRLHRFSLRKNDKDDPLLTEWENRQKQGYLRIWDCGHAKWVWTKTK